MSKFCEKCDYLKIRNWIKENGSIELKILAGGEPCRSDILYDAYIKEKDLIKDDVEI